MGSILLWAAEEAMADVPIDCKKLYKNELKNKRRLLTPPHIKNKLSIHSIAHVVVNKHIMPERMLEGHGWQQRPAVDDAGIMPFRCCVLCAVMGLFTFIWFLCTKMWDFSFFVTFAPHGTKQSHQKIPSL